MSKLKIKRVSNAIHIITDTASAIMPMTTQQETMKAMDTLIETIYQISHVNADLQKSVMDGSVVESYETKSTDALFDDVTLNIPSHVCKDLRKALECAPSHLQGQILKAVASVTSKIYRDCAEQIIQADDATLLSKSLLKKSMTITKDIELLADKLDEPLMALKHAQYEKAVKKDLLSKGFQQGVTVTKAKLAGVDNEVIETATAIVKAKSVQADEKKSLSSAIKAAKRVSE